MFCKYKEPDTTIPPTKGPEPDTRYRVKDRGDDIAHRLPYYQRYVVVRDALVWREQEFAQSSDKDAAEKIAALMNGQSR